MFRNLPMLMTAMALLVSFSAHAVYEEVDRGPLVGEPQNFTVSLEPCRSTWKRVSPTIARCEVRLHDYNPSFLLTNIRNLTNAWSYRGSDGWSVSVTITRTEYGYAIQLAGLGTVPDDRFQFEIAQKYIRDAMSETPRFAEAMYSSVVMHLNNRRGSGEAKAIQLVQRSVAFKSSEVLQACLYDIGAARKKICVLQMADYWGGEVVLSEAKHTARVSSSGGDKYLTLTLAAAPGWQIQGSFSLGYLRAEYEGPYTVNDFVELYERAARQIAIDKFSVLVQRLEGQPRKPEIFSEENLGFVRLAERRFDFDYAQCANSWSVSGQQARCAFKIPWVTVRLADNKIVYNKVISKNQKSLLITMTFNNNTYSVEFFGEAELVRRLENVKPFIQQAVRELPHRKFYEYALKLP